MSRPMISTQFVTLLDQWSIPHEPNDRDGKKWYEHNRNTKGKFDAVFGSMNHHTGGADNADGAKVLWYGYGSLPGPLCHGGIRTNGAVLLNGWGRTNHAGLGDDDVLQAVIHEDYITLGRPDEANTDGNRHFYGWEWMCNGLVNPETAFPKMWRTAVRLNAAICTYHNWTAKSCIGHGTWQPGKWDPGVAKNTLFNLARFQNHVQQAIEEGPKPKPPTQPTTKEIIIQKGDTLAAIAKKYSTTVIDLINLNPGLIRPGDILKLPVK